MNVVASVLISVVGGLLGVVFILLRADIKSLRDEMLGFRGEVKTEMSGFRGELKEHGERLARLETMVSFLVGAYRAGGPDPEAGEGMAMALRAGRSEEEPSKRLRR